ncbi:MAG: ankyrin repeat domain-containing protein [Bacteriovoracaceae bacterium]
MKFMVSPVLLLLTALLCFSCGKKEEKGPVSTNHPDQMTGSDRLFEARNELRKAVKANDTQNLRLVIFQNPDLSLNEPFDDGETLLTYAIKKRFPLVRNILLEKGASPNLKTQQIDTPGFTPLMVAAYLGDTATISSLILYQADLDAQDDLGDSALHKAIKAGFDDSAKMLVRAGCELDILNNKGRTPQALAEYLGRKDLGLFLQGLMNLENGAPTMPTFRQILLDGDVVNYRKLISYHPEVIKEFALMNPLILTMESANDMNGFEIAQSLLSLNVSANGPDDTETPPLVKAVEIKKKEFVLLLFRFNADPDLLDKNDRPALYYAIQNNDYDLVDILLNNNAETVIKKNGLPVFKACKTADSNERNLRTPEDHYTNHRIQSRLNCRWPR